MAFLEVSTTVPCVLNCEYCPQQILRSNYKFVEKNLSLEDFKISIDKLPNNSTISFSGFSDPFQNMNLEDMILYAYEKGHKIMLLTALQKATIERIEKIKDVIFEHCSIHLPDSFGKTPIKITDEYKNLLSYLIKNPPKGFFLFNHHKGDVHSEIRGIVPHSYILQIHDRADNLDNNEVIKCHKSGNITCGHLFLNDAGLLLPNMDVVLCCMDFGIQNKIGNLKEQTWEEIVNGEQINNIKFNLKNNGDCICRKCYLAI